MSTIIDSLLLKTKTVGIFTNWEVWPPTTNKERKFLTLFRHRTSFNLFFETTTDY